MMSLFEELRLRGLVSDCTHPEKLEALLSTSGVKFYCGFDPTGPSLHAGSLIQLTLMERLALAGHNPVALIGSATAMIGDPSGKSQERKMLDDDTILNNGAGIARQIRRVLTRKEIVNNKVWSNFGYFEFLRDVGKHVTVNQMLAKESVKSRIESREQGISYTEFSYMLLQAHDFCELAKDNVVLQIGGSDQWGNITLGIELAHKMGETKDLFGLVTPLLKTSTGEKFGKTEAGTAVWLDPELTSPFKFHQFWLNTTDEDVESHLKMFTFIRLNNIESIMTAHKKEPWLRHAQKILANEMTRFVHGPAALKAAQDATHVLFDHGTATLSFNSCKDLKKDIPFMTIERKDLDMDLATCLVKSQLAASKGAARKLIEQKSVYINNAAHTSQTNRPLNEEFNGHFIQEFPESWPAYIMLRVGKKNHFIVEVV